MRLEGRIALVTGGASGIGAATVRRLAAEGAHVADAASVRAGVAAAEAALGLWDHVLGVNLRGTIAVAHAVLDGMQRRGGGAIVNVGELGERLRQGMIDATLLGRIGRPEEVAAVVVFLACEDASYMTGQTLNVSGGLSMA